MKTTADTFQHAKRQLDLAADMTADTSNGTLPTGACTFSVATLLPRSTGCILDVSCCICAQESPARYLCACVNPRKIQRLAEEPHKLRHESVMAKRQFLQVIGPRTGA